MAAPQKGQMSKLKFFKPKETTDLEDRVAQAFVDLEASSNALKAHVKTLKILKCEKVDYGANKALVIMVPYVQRKAYKEINAQLQRELGKKFPNFKNIFFITQRNILPKNFKRRKGNQRRPRSRTLEAVQKAILDELVYPHSITGKRRRITTSGDRTMKVFLDADQSTDPQDKFAAYSAVFAKFCNKKAVF